MMTHLDWADKEELVLTDPYINTDFQLSKEYEEALLEWHRDNYPEEWPND